jgi:hypothetical protein
VGAVLLFSSLLCFVDNVLSVCPFFFWSLQCLLYVHLRLTVSDYPFDIFKRFPAIIKVLLRTKMSCHSFDLQLMRYNILLYYLYQYVSIGIVVFIVTTTEMARFVAC